MEQSKRKLYVILSTILFLILSCSVTGLSYYFSRPDINKLIEETLTLDSYKESTTVNVKGSVDNGEIDEDFTSGLEVKSIVQDNKTSYSNITADMSSDSEANIEIIKKNNKTYANVHSSNVLGTDPEEFLNKWFDTDERKILDIDIKFIETHNFKKFLDKIKSTNIVENKKIFREGEISYDISNQKELLNYIFDPEEEYDPSKLKFSKAEVILKYNNTNITSIIIKINDFDNSEGVKIKESEFKFEITDFNKQNIEDKIKEAGI